MRVTPDGMRLCICAVPRHRIKRTIRNIRGRKTKNRNSWGTKTNQDRKVNVALAGGWPYMMPILKNITHKQVTPCADTVSLVSTGMTRALRRRSFFFFFFSPSEASMKGKTRVIIVTAWINVAHGRGALEVEAAADKGAFCRKSFECSGSIVELGGG